MSRANASSINPCGRPIICATETHHLRPLSTHKSLRHSTRPAHRPNQGFRLRILHGCSLIFGCIQPHDLRCFLLDCPGSVLDTELATLAGASIAIGTPLDLDALKTQLRESTPVFQPLNPVA